MKNVLGLDIGSHTVKAVELRQTFRGLEPVQQRLHPRVDPDAALPDTLRRFLRMHQLPTDHVACAIAGDRATTRRLEFPFRDRKRLASAVPFELEGEIPFALEDVVVDWELVGGERNHGIVAATLALRSEVSGLLESLREAGCEPRILEAEGLVLANLTQLFELGGPRILLDLGHRKTTLCVLLDGRAIAARTIPLAGQALSEAIAKDRGWNPEDAESAKCEDGIFHLGFDSASPSAVAVLDRIAREVVRTLESMAPALAGEGSPVALTLFGGSARLHRIDEYLAERTGLSAARLALPSEGPGAALVAGGDPLVFAPAVALALRATAQAQTRMNFRQDEFAYRTDLRQFFGRELRWSVALASLAALLLGVSVGAGISLDSRRANQFEAETARLHAATFPDSAMPASPISAMREAITAAQDQAEFLGVSQRNGSALDLLGALSRQVPRDLRVKFEELNIDRRAIRIKVYAPSFEAADRLTAELAKIPVFGSAKVAGEITSERKRGGKTFNVNIRLDDREGRS